MPDLMHTVDGSTVTSSRGLHICVLVACTTLTIQDAVAIYAQINTLYATTTITTITNLQYSHYITCSDHIYADYYIIRHHHHHNHHLHYQAPLPLLPDTLSYLITST